MCLSVAKSLTLSITFVPTNETLSNDTRVNDLVTLTVSFILKIVNLDFLPPGAFMFHKHILFIIGAIYFICLCILFQHMYNYVFNTVDNAHRL